MTSVRAITAIRRNPLGLFEQTGRLNAEGRPILRSCGFRHAPGDIFDVSDQEELTTLLDLGAVELLDALL